MKPSNKKVLGDLDAAIDGGFRVKLYYEEKYMSVFFLGDTKHFVTKVERVKPQ